MRKDRPQRGRLQKMRDGKMTGVTEREALHQSKHGAGQALHQINHGAGARVDRTTSESCFTVGSLPFKSAGNLD
jgi:hypothetical protein